MFKVKDKGVIFSPGEIKEKPVYVVFFLVNGNFQQAYAEKFEVEFLGNSGKE